jgi:hypothetical protein
VKQQKQLFGLVLSFGMLRHLLRSGPTPFERRFLKVVEEFLIAIVKT